MRQHSRRIGLLSGLLWVLAVSAAWADGEIVRAKKLFQQAEAHFERGEFDSALSLYQQAYEAKPLPGFHFNIGQCYRNLGQFQQAINHFRLYLEQSPKPTHKQDAQRLIELSQQDLAIQQPTSAATPEGTAGPTTAPAPLAPSKSAVAVGRRHGLHPLYFWSAAGLTASLLVVGTVTGGLALGKSSTFKDPSTAAGDLQGLKDSGEALRTAANLSFGLGLAAAVGTGVLFYFTDFKIKETAPAAVAMPGGGMVLWSGVY